MNAKRCRALALCAVLLVLCTLQAVKADAADGQYSLTIVSRFDGNAFVGRTFSLYAVALPAAEGKFTYLPAFADCGTTLPESGDAASWSRCASALWQWAQQRAIVPDAQQQTDADGICTFQGLAAGLYLVTGSDVVLPEGSCICAPFLVGLPGVDEAGSGRVPDVTAVTKDAFRPAEPDTPTPPGPADPSEPDVPDTPDIPDTPDTPDVPDTPDTPGGDRLPQTGQLNWPVPVLAGVGLVLFLAGLLLLRRRHA